MLDALPRRAVLGRLAVLPLISGAGFLVATEPVAASADLIARIDAAGRQCAEAKQAFDAALAVYLATIPQAHWSIGGESGRRSLCARAVCTSASFPGGPHFLPTKHTLDDDYDDFWRAKRDDPDACRSYRLLTRRLKARLKRYEAKIAEHVDRHGLKDLQARCRDAERCLLKLAEEAFKEPATTLGAVQAQARALRAFAKSSTEMNRDWRIGAFALRLAEGLDNLDLAA